MNLISTCVSFSDQAIEISLWILKEHNNFSYLWKFELDRPNSFAEIMFEKLETIHLTMYGSWTLRHPAIGCYLLCDCLQRAENCTNCLNYQLFLILNFICAYLVKSYADEQKCLQWRQQRFACSPCTNQYSWLSLDKEIVFNFNSDTRCCSFVWVLLLVGARSSERWAYWNHWCS